MTVFADPAKELDRLHDLYERLTDVRRELGAPQVPFHKFAGLVREQVAAMKRKGVPEVAFRVAVHDGKIALHGARPEGQPGDGSATEHVRKAVGGEGKAPGQRALPRTHAKEGR